MIQQAPELTDNEAAELLRLMNIETDPKRIKHDG